jgi:hypothetical protein
MIQNLIWSIFGKKYLLGGVVEIYKFFTGYRTQIISVLIAITYTLKVFGYLPVELADKLLALLSGSGGVTLLSKFRKWDEDFKLSQRTQELKALALEQLAKDGVIASGAPTLPAVDPSASASAAVDKPVDGLRG